ncbi:MAG: hypothetical protein HUJ99_06460, partial [Bacteroidaceae bacterium]|nr:hypothetical protein [Bacteroidaceae bacterium]
MTDEQIKELCRRVNRIVLDDEPDTFQTLSDLALAGNERARDCLSIYYGMSNLALDHNMEWAFREVVSDPLAYFYNGEEYLEFLC